MSYVPNGFKSAFPNGSLTRHDRTVFSDAPFPDHAITRSHSATARNRIASADDSACPIIVHCHLCWDWVWQRPQQFVSRLSRRHKILFIETIGPDPQLLTPFARFRTDEQFPNVTLLRLQFPSWRWGDSDFVDCERRRLVKEFLGGPAAGQFENPVQWFYDPMAASSFVGHMGEIATVYDCMDELSKFSEAPPEIIGREAGLLAMADVVFTGGRRLYENKRRMNSNCHFYGCGVDVEHFGKASGSETKIPEDIASLPRPVLGYFGVVDERMDYELVAKLADANPNGSVVMVGPALKVDKVPLPRRHNLHWLGQRAYADLPAYAKAFDVCLMPFALNAATEFINPTKALEYMATGRPVVSSAVPDVVRNFGSVIKVAGDHDEFITSCQRAIKQKDAAAIESGMRMASENSWESIVTRLEEHLDAALRNKRTARQMHE
jgi:glycosyltransferase involved in cell wall biosynthesis